MEQAIEVNNLVKSYGKIEAVKGISFNVQTGEIFGLIGPNGAGKTTSLRIISTLLQVTSGSVKVFGCDVSKKAPEIRKMISYLPEEAGAYKNLSGKAYLEFIAGFYSDNTMIKKGMEIAQLGERIKDKVSTYSKGMTRKLLVARALMMSPKLAILDEPTSGLDVVNSKGIREIIKDFVKSGTTILLSSHNMLEIEFLCDRIALINNGMIVETGTPQELKAKHNVNNIEEVFLKAIV
ncbi:MAG: ABC transporter ATP-binding protein [bacterium]|nr:ABC transporter ATP-binding protein [bacterium]